MTFTFQDSGEFRRRGANLYPLPCLLVTMLRHDLMPLEIHCMPVIGQRRRQLRCMGFGGLPRGAGPSQPSFPLPSHFAKPPLANIVAGSCAGRSIADTRHRRSHRLAVSKDESRKVFDLATFVGEAGGSV